MAKPFWWALTGADRAASRAALDRAGGDIKTALLLLEGCEPDEAAAILERAGGQLHPAREAARRHAARRKGF